MSASFVIRDSLTFQSFEIFEAATFCLFFLIKGEMKFLVIILITLNHICISSGQLVRSYTDTRAVSSIYVDSGILFSGNSDFIIRYWSISSGSQIRSYTGHASNVRALFVDSGSLFSASFTLATICQWDITNGQLVRSFSDQLLGTGGPVYSLFVDSGFLFTGGGDKNVRQWNIATGLLVRRYIGHTGSVSSVFIMSGSLFSGSYDATIRQLMVHRSAVTVVI